MTGASAVPGLPRYPECRNTAGGEIHRRAVPQCGKQCEKVRQDPQDVLRLRGLSDCDCVVDTPIAEKCEACGSMMVLHRLSNGSSFKKCSNPTA